MASKSRDSDKYDPWEALAATEPTHEAGSVREGDDDEKLNGLLQRINRLTQAQAGGETVGRGCGRSRRRGRASIRTPTSSYRANHSRSAKSGLSESEVEALVLKLLLSRGDLVGRDIADHIRLPFVLVDELLRQLKRDQLVVYRGSAAMNDYLYQLTDLGRERARRLRRALQLLRRRARDARCLCG